jgi:FkbH-like protein
MLDPTSGLYQFEPDVLICAVHASRLFPDIHQFPFDLTQEERADAVEAGVRTLENLLDTFTARSPALVLVHNMVVPQHPALGVLDLRDELGQAELFGEINRRLAEVVRTRYRNVYVVDEDRVQSQHGKAQATDARLWLTARMGWSHPVLAGLAKEYLRYLLPLKGLSRKCVVLDLDNTLWGGVIGDDGLSGIQVGAEAPGNAFLAFQRELERLWRRGILLAICSKNNPKTALAVFDEHPDMVLKRSHFSAWRINWEPKPSNMRAIAEELNIGLSSLVFLDDSPIERLAMRTELPQVMTPELPADPAQYRQALLELGVFDGLSFTEEDRSRNQLYAEQRARTELEAEYRSAGTSLQDYLQDLDIIVEIDPINHLTLPRVAQLTSKTNQFNLTTRRYSEAQIDEAVARGWLVYSMRVVDRFGDNGLVAVALLSPQPNHTWEVDTFLMSCRVMGRGVETAFLAHLAAEARDRGGTRLQGWYLPTAANMPVQDLYREHGFMLIHEDGNGNQLWDMDLIDGGALTPPTWLTVRVGSTVEA